MRDLNDVLRDDGGEAVREVFDRAKVVSTHDHIAERIKQTAKQIELELISWDQIKLSTVARYLVKNIIPAVGLVVVYGPPKCGKTFWVFDLVMHIALGWEYRGHRTHQGSVLYCLFEGQTGFTARVEAFRQSRLAEQADSVPFHLLNTRIALVKDHPRLIAAVKQHAGNKPPAAVVLDTLNRSFTGSESSDADMTAYVSAADAIREAFDCTVIIVHHCGLEAGRPRGHTALLGAADAQIGVVKDSSDNVVASVEYMKDGPAEGEIVSRLKVVDVGIDDDGEPITSCIVEPAERSSNANNPKLSKNQQTMFGILHEAGRPLLIEDWYARAREEGLGVKRKADLTDFRIALKSKGLIYHGSNGWAVKHG